MSAVVHGVVGALALTLCLAAAAVGGWRWYRVEESRAFWPLLRAGQVALAFEAAFGGVLAAVDRKTGGHLHLLYGVLPIVVMFFAEQLRIGAAQQVLDARGLEDSAAVGRLPAREQRSVVVAILRRELGVMVLAALVAVALGLRAMGTAGWL